MSRITRLDLDPRTRIILVFNASLMALVLDNWASLLALCALCLLPFLTNAQWTRRALGLSALVVWSTVVSQSLFYSAEPRVALAHLGPLTVWREGVTYGLVQSMRMVAVGLAGVALAIRTPPDRLFAGLLRLRLPFGLALMAGSAFRFLPELAQAWTVVRQARSRRGRPAHRRTPWAWLTLEVSLLRPLVARAIRRAWCLGESLDSRGFDPVAPRAVRNPLAFAAFEPPLIAMVFGLTFCALGMRLMYLLYTWDSVYIPALRPVYAFVRGWL